jgi:O-antigen/teichoic acid export membrane protein
MLMAAWPWELNKDRGVGKLAIDTLRFGIFANIAARLVSALLMLAFVPLFVRLLGSEAYGLIVLSSTGISILGNVDLGLSMTLNREVAAGATVEFPHFNLMALAGTLEVLYWMAALLVSTAGLLLAPYLTGHWLNIASLPADSVVRALRLMVPSIALQLPVTIYSAALLGRGRQASLSIIASAASSVRTIGAAALLVLYKPDIELYFALQLAVTLAQVLVMRRSYRRQFPAATPSTFRSGWAELGRLWHFSAGVAVISGTAVLISQMDKILISWLLPLRDVGYYGIAWALTAGLRILSAPVFNALFPRLTKAVSKGGEEEVGRVYHSSNQLLSVMIWPAAWLLALFPEPLLYLWTHNAGLARSSAPALALLSIGGALNGISLLPFALQLAYGWTRLTLRIYLWSLLVMVPGLYFAASTYGLTGAAAMWPIFNLGCLAAAVILMHRRLLRDGLLRWVLQDSVAPCLATLLAALLLLPTRPETLSLARQAPWFAFAYLVLTAAAVLAAPTVRSLVLQAARKLAPR